MTITRNKKTAAGIGIAAAAAAAVALGTGTYAAFSDTQAGPSATLAAGTLGLNIGATPASALNFTATAIAPGYTSGPLALTFSNNGTITGDLSIALTTANTEDGCGRAEQVVDTTCTAGSTAGELGAALNIKIDVNGANAYNGPVNGIPGGSFPLGQLTATGTPGNTLPVTVTYSLPTTTGNEVQGDSVAVTTVATLNQHF